MRRMEIRRLAKDKGRSGDATNFFKTALDSHADTSRAGSNMAVLELTGEKVTVYPFSENLQAMQEVPIATALMVWESPTTGEPWMLVIHEALYLLCRNQIRPAGNVVRDAPIQFDATSTYSISIPCQLEIPLELHGVILCFHSRKPTPQEIENYQEGLLQFFEHPLGTILCEVCRDGTCSLLCENCFSCLSYAPLCV